MFVKILRLKSVWPWLVEKRYMWLSMAVICVALVISLRPHTNEPIIRYTGLLLQLFGILTVIWGISETKALFGHPSFAGEIKAWLDRCPLLRRNVVLAVDNATMSMMVGKARAHQTYGPGENPTVETRLEALEKNVTAIHERISQTQKEMDEELQKTGTALKHEEQSRQTEDNAIREKLEATGTGGVHISAMGVLWLFVGVILSTAAPEVAMLLK